MYNRPCFPDCQSDDYLDRLAHMEIETLLFLLVHCSPAFYWVSSGMLLIFARTQFHPSFANPGDYTPDKKVVKESKHLIQLHNNLYCFFAKTWHMAGRTVVFTNKQNPPRGENICTLAHTLNSKTCIRIQNSYQLLRDVDPTHHLRARRRYAALTSSMLASVLSPSSLYADATVIGFCACCPPWSVLL